MVKLVIVKAIENKLAFALVVYKACIAQYAQVLRGNRLLQVKGTVYFVNVYFAVVVYVRQKFDAQWVRKCPKNSRRSVYLPRARKFSY
jgi:hypothetical protein